MKRYKGTEQGDIYLGAYCDCCNNKIYEREEHAIVKIIYSEVKNEWKSSSENMYEFCSLACAKEYSADPNDITKLDHHLFESMTIQVVNKSNTKNYDVNEVLLLDENEWFRDID